MKKYNWIKNAIYHENMWKLLLSSIIETKNAITPLLMLFDFRKTKQYKLNYFESLLKLDKV